MHNKALAPALLLASAAAVGASIAPQSNLPASPVSPRVAAAVPRATVPAVAAPALQAAAPSRLATAIGQWDRLRASDNEPFSAYASFLTYYRGWPGENQMRRNAEKAIDPARESPSQVAAFFQVHPPLSATGHARHAFALLALGRHPEATHAARRAWQQGALSSEDETRLWNGFARYLTTVDHETRLERLLADGDERGAERLVYLASPARRPIFEARVALQKNSSDAPARLAALGGVAATDPGLLMDQAKWRRDNRQASYAAALLGRPRTLSGHPHDAEKWFETLLSVARSAESDGDYAAAYRVASQVDDAYPAGTEIIDRSYGERDEYTSLVWLAGTTALHRLNRPAEAAQMFVRYAKGGRSTQVLTKGYYWAGRAALQAGQQAIANSYFEQAAAHPELFYGQLALERLGRPVPPPPANPTPPSAADRAAFASDQLVQATRLLGQMGRWSDQSLFIRTLSESLENDAERALALELARQIHRPDLAVWVARSARNSGDPFYIRAAYPEARIPSAHGRYWALAHGIIRQESSFDPQAVSHAGARGLMQLMPGTARETAGKLDLSYSLGRLTSDPDYNIRLGSSYFARLMGSWDDYAPLAAASYNAGPGNVRKWLNRNGDPRTSQVDVIRWIEDIPFGETKGYVQRVLENAVVYDTLNPSRGASHYRLSYYLGKQSRPG